MIVGGTGRDVMSGGGGCDTFALANGDFAFGESIFGDSGYDRIVLTSGGSVDLYQGSVTSVEALDGRFDTVVFTANIDSVAHSFVYIRGTSAGTPDSADELVDLVGVSANGPQIVELSLFAGASQVVIL